MFCRNERARWRIGEARRAMWLEALFLSGYDIQATAFGKPNIGYPSSTEYIDYGRHIAAAVDIPIIMGGMPDYVDVINVRRVAEEYFESGLAALSLEDQVRVWSPHATMKTPLRPTEEMCRVIGSAREAAPDLVLVASTYAIFESIDEIVTRCSAYSEAGADIVRPMLAPLLGYMGATASTQNASESSSASCQPCAAPCQRLHRTATTTIKRISCVLACDFTKSTSYRLARVPELMNERLRHLGTGGCRRS